MAFPPVPVYPEAIDSDYTLFLVHNTTETRLSVDNLPWSQEIEIIPVSDDQEEIWSDNGFANIEGELLYYGSVEKNASDKVVTLKECSRQLGGEKTKSNKKGTWIRSFVVAEHHNQLANAIIKTEDFIGYNFDTRQETLDWKIRNLQSLDIIYDDFTCPNIVFTFNITEEDPTFGTTAFYELEFLPVESVNNFRLDFGDGEYTTTELSGTHVYPVNSRIDPIVTFSNDKCEIIQSPIERENPAEPAAEIEEVFEIPIPEIPDIPDFTFVPCDVPEPDVVLPPLVFPCLSLEGSNINIPSVIIGPDINMVSYVLIEGPDYPVQILHSVVEIIGDIDIPSIITIDPPIPPTIIIDPPIPPTIVIVAPDSNITVELDASELPRLEVDWGMPPEMEVALTMAKTVKSPERFSVDSSIVDQFGEEFSDLFETSGTMKVEYESVGIPEEIRIIPPTMPDVKFNTSNFPKDIQLKGIEIPSDIQIYGPESPIPNSIKLDGSELPESVDLVYQGQPIPLDVPNTIELKMEKEIPDKILLDTPNPIPDRIVLEHDLPETITLEGPSSIPLSIPEGLTLPLSFPDEMPSVEMVYHGAPIEVKITMDDIMAKDSTGGNCVMIVPCNNQ